VSEVVERRGGANDRIVPLLGSKVIPLAQHRESSTREVVRAERVLEARVRRAGVDEVRPAELADVAQPLKDVGVNEAESDLVDADVVPERVAQDLESHGGKVTPAGRAVYHTP